MGQGSHGHGKIMDFFFKFFFNEKLGNFKSGNLAKGGWWRGSAVVEIKILAEYRLDESYNFCCDFIHTDRH